MKRGNGKPTVMLFHHALWKGSDSAGPNTSIRHLCRALADEYNFLLVARNRSLYGGPATEPNRWQEVDGIRTCYLAIAQLGARGLRNLLRETDHDIVHLNSFFDRELSFPILASTKVRLTARKPTLLSPRGEFARGALSLKPRRKKAYIGVAKATRLLDGVTVHATSEAERKDILFAKLGRPIVRAQNIRSLEPLPSHKAPAAGAPLRAAFVGRVSPVKGLDCALSALQGAAFPIEYDIYGPIGDSEYWKKCQAIIANAPASLKVNYKGEIAQTQVVPTLARYDVLLLPSASENFGHAIFDSLCAGTPVIISDQTPWQNLEARQAGVTVRLQNNDGVLRDAIERFARTHSPAWRSGARKLAEEYIDGDRAIDHMKNIYADLLTP